MTVLGLTCAVACSPARSATTSALPRPGAGAPHSPRPAGAGAPDAVRATGDIRGQVSSAAWGKPVVTEQFDGTRLDPRKWMVYDSPDARENPRTESATRVSGGRLRLTGGVYRTRDLSGGIASRLHQRYGRWEVRMRAERGVGYSAVALLWPERFGDPEYAEINFAEVIDPTRRSVGLFVHRGPDDEQTHHVLRTDFTRWHTVAVDWLPRSLTFWLDGRKVWTYRGPLIPQRTPMGLALQNDQVCDRGRGFCRDRTTPRWVTMDVDWVRIYRAPGASAPHR
ncbi:MAG: hypothetical protein JWO67_3902 [Streptosporangiaceae bacterium]|jgi:beta-glucanase (GH16 family)|nr:hypothetical protein [Streptosporangiaceae bacterium]